MSFQIYADFKIIEVLPNTLDDSSLEYVLIQNISQEEKSLSGYTLSDLKKEYIIMSGSLVGVGETQKFLRPQTKLILNNSNEEIFLRDSFGEEVDSVSYASSVKGEVLFFPGEQENIEVGNKVDEQEQESGGEVENPDQENGDISQGEENTQEIYSEVADDSGEKSSDVGEPVTGPDATEKLQEIIFEFQRPSYITQSGSTDIYICDSDRDECKVNFNLEASFTQDFKKSDHYCALHFGGIGEDEQDKCNPNTVIFPQGVSQVVFQIFHEDSHELMAEKKMEIIFDRSLEAQQSSHQQKHSSARIALSKPKIIVQSGLSGGGTNFYCNKQPCKFNLNHERIHPDIGCFWDFGPGTARSETTRERCNPGYVDIPEGLFELALRVYEKDFPDNTYTTRFFIHNIPEPQESEVRQEISDELMTSHADDIGVSMSAIQEDGELIKSGENEPVFSGAILLQGKIGKEKSLSGNTLECIGVDRCYVNFIFETPKNSEDIEYHWFDNNGEFFQGMNPGGYWLSSGEHKITLQAYSDGILLGEDNFHVSVREDIQEDISPVVSLSGKQEPTLFGDAMYLGDQKEDTLNTKIPGFTQNYLSLKYDGLRISGKAPAGSHISILSGGNHIGSQSIDETGKYRIVSKDFQAREYSFSTKIILESGEEIFLEQSGTKILTLEDRAYWFQGKPSSSGKTTTSYIPKTPQLVIKQVQETPKETVDFDESLSFSSQILYLLMICMMSVFVMFHIIYQVFYSSVMSVSEMYISQFSTRQRVCLILG